MDERFDVVIVGLGPAGSSLAYFLRNSGLKVVGLDLVGWDGIWGKPCGDAIGRHHFEETGLPTPKGEALRNIVKGIDIYSPSEEIKLRVEGEGYIINRNAYGRYLLEEAMSGGVEVRLQSFVVKPVFSNGRLAGVEYKDLKTGEKKVVGANVVVDATGTSQVIRRKLPRDWPAHELLKDVDANLAYRRIVDLDREIEDYHYIRIYVNQDIAPGGYWWYFPEGPTSVNVGLGVQHGRGYPHPKTIFEEKLLPRKELQRIVRVRSDAGALVPTRRPANTLVWDNFLGIGDNGFTVNPIHGGGMGYAMTAAYYSAKRIVEAAETGDYSARGPLWKVNIDYNKHIGAKQASLDIFRIYLQTVSNDVIEWGLRAGIVDAAKAYNISSEGELEVEPSVLDKLGLVVRNLTALRRLLQLRTVASYMKSVKKLYLEYPETPDGLPGWVQRVESLYAEFKKKIGVDW